jgi:hypothetical protein
MLMTAVMSCSSSVRDTACCALRHAMMFHSLYIAFTAMLAFDRTGLLRCFCIGCFALCAGAAFFNFLFCCAGVLCVLRFLALVAGAMLLMSRWSFVA